MAIIGGCSCDDGNGNTLTPSCLELFGLANGVGLQNTIKNTGVRNGIDISSVIGTAFTDLLYSTDKTSRIYPITGLRNVDFPQEEPQYDNDNTNQKDFLRDGILSFAAEKRGVNGVYASKLNQAKCTKNSEWVFTENGVWGAKVSDYTLGTHMWYPLPVNAFNAQWMPKKGDAVEKVMITNDFSATLNVGELWMIPYSELGITLEDLDLAGLLDVNFQLETAAVSAAATTTVSYRLLSDYGQGVVTTQNVDGLVTADFVGTDITTGIALGTFVVTEVVDDKYTFSYDTETTGDIIEIKMASSATVKFEGSVRLTEPTP
jgi:hypothetical protein